MSTKTCPYCAEEIQPSAIKCKHCGSWVEPAMVATERLTRSTTDRMFSGICGGLAKFIGVDSTWIRIAFVVADVFTGIFPLLIIYLILAFVIPEGHE